MTNGEPRLNCSTSSRRQTNIQSFGCPKLSKNDNNKFQKLLAMHDCMTATLFAQVKLPHLREALRVLRTSVTLTSQKVLTGNYLNTCCEIRKKKVDSLLANEDISCFTSNSWSNINDEVALKNMPVSSKASQFFESVFIGEKGHDTNYIYRDMCQVIERNLGRLLGVFMVNTAANKAAWLFS